MKKMPAVPFFEIGVKNYVYGEEVVKVALAADAAAQKYDVDVLMIVPYTEIYRVAQNTQKLLILAPHMDYLRPGKGLADVLPEAIKAAGAHGVVLNHSERALPLSILKKTIDRAKEVGLFTFVCADSIAEARAVAHLGPDIINTEESELIGAGRPSEMRFMMESVKAIKEIDPAILVEQAAGITSGQQVYEIILAGMEAAGAASGVFASADPCARVEELVAAVRRAIEGKVAVRRGLKSEKY